MRAKKLEIMGILLTMLATVWFILGLILWLFSKISIGTWIAPVITMYIGGYLAFLRSSKE